jgi:hypothetical protein
MEECDYIKKPTIKETFIKYAYTLI